MHAIISTHTPRHLRRTLLGVVAQSSPPATVTVSCDSDDPAIAAVVQKVVDDVASPILLVQRPHQGESRSSQVRNNAVRARIALPHNPDDILWFLDGDCIPDRTCVQDIHTRAASRRLIIAFRIDLTPEQTEAITDDNIAHGNFLTPTAAQLDSLKNRHRRYLRHAFVRRLGLGKAHKPKLLSANFAVSLADYLSVNGFDESYTGYGQEDDDFGRRLYATGVRPVIAVSSALAYHQHHPTRAPQAWHESPNAARFAQPFTTRCEQGVISPAPQPQPVIRLLRSD